MARQIVVDIIGDSSGFSKSVDEAKGKAGALTDVGKGIAMGIGSAGFNLAADAVMGFVGNLGAAAQAYRDDETSRVNLDKALRNNVTSWDGSTAAIERYAAAQAARGFEDDAVRQSIGQLVGITHDQAKAMELTTLAQDLARSKGIDLASATDIVTKAAQGNGKALKSMGIDIAGAKDAAGMLDAIQRNVAGSADAWAQTSEGKVAVSNVKQAESWERIGSVVDRITQAVMPLVTDALSVVADVITDVASRIEPLVAQFQQGLGPAVAGVSPILSGLGETFRGIFDSISAIVSSVVESVTAVWSVFGDDILNVAQIAFGYVGDAIGNALKVVQGIFDVFAGIFTGKWDRVWKGLGEIFSGIWDQIRNVLRTALTLLGNALGGLGDLVRGAWDGITTGIRTGIETVVGWFAALPGRLASAIGGLFDGIPKAFKAALNWLIRMWNDLKFTIGPFDLGPLGTIGPWTLATPNLPTFHQGGTVPGTPGSEVLAVLQAGERVIPRGAAGSGGTTVVVNINGGLIDGPTIDALTNALARRLRYAPGT